MNDLKADPPADQLLAVRLIELLIANAAVLALFAAVGGVAGYAVSSQDSRPYVTMAVVEVGVRYPKEPLENSLVARERLAGHLAEAARHSADPEAEIEVTARRDPTTRALIRYLDLSVGAKTASAAATIAQRGINTFVAEHEVLYKYELDLVERERVHYERWMLLLQAAVSAPPGSSQAPKASDIADLGSALFETERLINVAGAMLSEMRTPPTRVVSGPSLPLQPASRAKTMAIGGVMIGLVVAVAFASLRAVAKKLAA